MSDKPRFKVGDLVTRGNGNRIYKVVAVITTGRIPTYDLVGPKQFTGVIESRLMPAKRGMVRR